MKSFLKNTRGNVAIMFGFMAVPIIFVTGMTIDYSVAARVHTKLNAAADAAALAAVTPAMMAQSDTTATAAAKSMFSALMTGMSSLQYNPAQVTVTVAHPNGNNSVRNVTVSYLEQSKNIFAGVLGAPTIYVSGTATASASIAPNIDFYLLLDASASMLFPSTQAGINQMFQLTSGMTGGSATYLDSTRGYATQGQTGALGQGCAFACHQADTSSAGGEPYLTNPLANTSLPLKTTNPNMNMPIDNLALARKYSIGLRTDEIPTAVSALMTTAANDQANIGGTPPIYRMRVDMFDDTQTNLMPITANYSSSWASNSSKYAIKGMWRNNVDCNSQSPCTGSGSGTADAKTNFDDAFNYVNQAMPNPGNGTNIGSDSPQEILFLVSDGMEDEMSGSRHYQPINSPARNGSSNWCTTIKGRGIKIAVLYTTYLPLTDGWSVSNIMPFLPQVAPAMQACATSGLYFEVSPGGNIAASLSALFQLAVQSSHLTQ